MVLLAFGGLFDAYMISTGGNIAPGLYKAHLLTAKSNSFFDLHSYATFNCLLYTSPPPHMCAARLSDRSDGAY